MFIVKYIVRTDTAFSKLETKLMYTYEYIVI